jgi:mannosyltransferase
MKIIYDDIIYSLQRAGGISLYWAQLEKHLKQDIRLIYPHCERNIFYSSVERITMKKKCHALFERYGSVNLSEKDPFIFHSSYYRYCKNKNAINVTTIHDFTYEHFRKDIKSNIHKWQKKCSIYHSDGIICVSENTKNDLLNIFQNYEGIVKIIYEGYSNDYVNLDINKTNTAIYIGSRVDYKNFKYAVKIISVMPKMVLDIIGGGKLTRSEILYLESLIPGRYNYYYSLTNQELNRKYNEANFLLYPSKYEGFGIPVVEAQAACCPVVCCEISSLPEVGGDAVIYISGKDINADIQAISRLDDKCFYDKLIERGLINCKRFSWEACAKQTLEFYQEVWNQKANKLFLS